MSEYVKEGTIKTEGSDVGTSDAVERIAETTKGASSQEDHDAQKEDVTAALGAKAEHSKMSKEDGPASHADEAD
ncbi:hypothetical protein MUK42_27402 [Musa troglodytarum]|uniref:Uncharacterized protein n=1 Tax=Musa troglodytarum TaxID=320322 RepID=A0A9E7F2T6_9LILI|nr:hypothetical protein MUK42_27402 [Musa troglodytarum]